MERERNSTRGRRIAVVTGTSRGLGLEIARQLRDLDYDVIATSRDAVAGSASARELGLPFRQLDVGDPKSIAAFARDLGDVDVLVNNAGIALDGFDANVARRTIDVNFYGAMRTTDAVLPHMRSGGRVVMVSSGLGRLSNLDAKHRGRFADPSLTRDELVALVEEFVRDVVDGTHAEKGWPSSAYSVSKIAMNALVRVLARELAGDPRRILVNTSNPGWVRTRMGGAGAPRSVHDGAKTPVFLATLRDGGPTGKFFSDEREVPF